MHVWPLHSIQDADKNFTSTISPPIFLYLEVAWKAGSYCMVSIITKFNSII